MIAVVYVRWIDAHGGQGQSRLKTALESRPDIMETAGILVNEGEDFLTVVQDLFGGESDYDGERQVRQYTTIPKGDIQEIIRWEVPETKKDE